LVRGDDVSCLHELAVEVRKAQVPGKRFQNVEKWELERLQKRASALKDPAKRAAALSLLASLGSLLKIQDPK